MAYQVALDHSISFQSNIVIDPYEEALKLRFRKKMRGFKVYHVFI